MNVCQHTETFFFIMSSMSFKSQSTFDLLVQKLHVLSEQEHLVSVVTAVVIAALTYIIYNVMYATDVPHIHGLPEIPGAVPVFGHLLKLGEDHASTCEKWWRQYKHSVFQVKLGNTRVVVVNSFDDCKKMLLANQNAVIDRPKLFTFHGLISSTQGFTIGSSPWDESCKKKRKAAGTALSRPALRSYYPMFDLESFCILRDMRKDSQNGQVEIDVRPYIQRFALNTTLTLCYGIRMDAVYDDLLREILHVGSSISLLRSASENYQDYVPIMRYLPNNEKNARSKELRHRRDVYLDLLLNKVREMIKNGTDKPCIASAILKDQETKLSGVEVSSICLSLVSGGFETIPGTLTSCIGSLCTKEGQVWQDRAYEDIKRHYPDIGEAWTSCIKEEKIPYINAIVKEAGRYYTVSSMSLPRKTVTEVNWNGAIIPAKTMILINAQAGNHVKGYVAVVTGGRSGIGYMISRGLVANGAKVYIVDIGPLDEQLVLLNELGKEAGGTAHGMRCDVSDKDEISKLLAYISEREDHVDMLVSNAGIRRDPPRACNVLKAPLSELQASLWSSHPSDWVDTFKVNTTAHYFLTVAFLKLLDAAAQRDLGDGRVGRSEGRGMVLLMSSCASMHNATNVDLTSYATSKAATDHLVKLLAAKLSRFYIRVVGMNPGCKLPFFSLHCENHDEMAKLIDTVVPSNMNKIGQEDNIFSNLFDKVPAKRAGDEQDMIGTVLFLASRAGAYVDGVNICVDGGRVLVANGQE
ncbi:Phenylacetate 2-hydroxylase [Beauveria bassiana]|nr:Phenylacetate 2-hydroxylase [Beauveria bassiana]